MTTAEQKASPLQDDRVQEIFMDCLFTGKELEEHGAEEIEERAVVARGVQSTVGFHPERLEGYCDEVAAMLAELPEGFSEENGGWTFLNACNDRHGRQWTDLHQRMEQLFQLGVALKLALRLDIGELVGMPGLSMMMPGGVPYFVVLDADRDPDEEPPTAEEFTERMLARKREEDADAGD
jgi:hypothetical protein